MSKNEKMMILQMLERGQISADDAAKLLQAASGDTSKNEPAPYKESDRRESDRTASRTANNQQKSPPRESAESTTPYTSSTMDSIPNSNSRRTSSSDGISIELSRKFDTFIKDIEPKVTRFTEAVVEKTAQTADKISRSLSSPTPPSHTTNSTTPPRHATTPSPSASGCFESSLELKVSSHDSELNIAGFNGSVMIKGYNGDKITARLLTRPKRSGAPIKLMTLGNKYFLSYDENDFHQVSIDAYVPESMFYVLKATSVSGIVNISTIKATYVIVENSNSDIELSKIRAESIKIDCQNGGLRLSELVASSVSGESTNGSINASALDVKELSLSAFNGALNLDVAGFNTFNNYTWAVDTSNGKLNLFLPSLPNIGYHIKAHTSLGDIKIGLTGITHLINEKSVAEAKSFNFDSAPKKVCLALETSNAPLVIS